MSAEEHATIRAAKEREARSSVQARRAAGVVHTPMEVARWAVGRVHACLIEDFGLLEGLADPGALVLDPALGTGVWLAAVLERTRGSVRARRMWGYELDASALAIARALIEPEARAQRVNLRLHCANTLCLGDPWPHCASGVRVIVGNPPWAARSQSRGAALSDAWLAEFRRDPSGASLGERRSGVLSDDYVRFFRWALEQARTSPAGAVVCFATNSSYLDGPVHRGMRAALASAFDRIEVLDLGGNALLSRAARRDENVFGVRVGAALTLLLRLPGNHARAASVSVQRVEGSRADKLGALSRLDRPRGPATQPAAPWFAYRARAFATRPGFSLAEAFPFHREGLQSNRDELAIASTREALRERLAQIAKGELPLAAARHFEPARARERLVAALRENLDAHIVALAYRPFDARFVCTVTPLCHRPRPELLRAMAHSEVALLSVRKDRGAAPFTLFAAASHVADACFLSTRSSCRTRVFPSHTPDGVANLAPRVEEALASKVGAVSPTELIHYTLGVLASETFRTREGEELKQDYPRIPWPISQEAWLACAEAGRRVAEALDASSVANEQGPPEERRSRARRAERHDGSVAVLCQPADVLVDPRILRFEPAQHTLLTRAGELVARGVTPEAWSSGVGHHTLWRLMAARNGCLRLSDLLVWLRRAQRWCAALAQADRAFLAHFA